MKFVQSFYLTFFLSVCAGAASSGTISFSGMITEPACTTEVSAQSTLVQCVRGGAAKQQSYVRTKSFQPSPFALADVKIERSSQRRGITLIDS